MSPLLCILETCYINMQPKAVNPFTHTGCLPPGQMRLMFSGPDNVAPQQSLTDLIVRQRTLCQAK